MSQKKYKNSSPRIKVIQKIYNSLMNPGAEIEYPKNQYKKFIKDVVSGTLERTDLIEETINSNLSSDINLVKTDKLLKIILLVLPAQVRVLYLLLVTAAHQVVMLGL